MKSEQVEGVVEKVAGKAQSAVGKLFGDSKLEAKVLVAKLLVS